MKTTIYILALAALLLGTPANEAQSRPYVSFGVFYSNLSPYGEWIDCNLGYVWRPAHLNPGWRPYLYGHWTWSDYGWYWVSAEPYGWATFHYGRWYYDDYYGWIWIPDDVWGPAWVEWRYDDDYLGWAPLGPYATWSFDVGITYQHPWVAPYHYWNFVTYHNFTADRIADCVQPVDRNPRIFGHTRGVVDIRSADNRIVNRGIDVGTIEHRGNIRVRNAEIVDGGNADRERVIRDGNRDRVEVFRPRLDARLRDDMTRPRQVEQANKRIATDFEQSPRERHQDRIRSFERERSPIMTPPRDRQAPDNGRSGGMRDIPGARIDQNRNQDRAPAQTEKGWRLQQPNREPQPNRVAPPPADRNQQDRMTPPGGRFQQDRMTPPGGRFQQDRSPRDGGKNMRMQEPQRQPQFSRPGGGERRQPQIAPPRQKPAPPRESGKDDGGHGRRGGGRGW